MRHIIQSPPFMPPSSFPGMPPGPPTMPMAPRQGQGATGPQSYIPVSTPSPVPFSQGPTPYMQGAAPFTQGAAPLMQGPTPYAQAPLPFMPAQTPFAQSPFMAPQGPSAFTPGQAPQLAASQLGGFNPLDLYQALQGLTATPAQSPAAGWTAGRQESNQD